MALYVPEHFAVQDPALLQQFMDAHPFATVISADLMVSHVPVLRVGEDRLQAHMARANPHWQTLPNGEVLVIFGGPHAYVSPAWYQSTREAVPTWNYATVHVHGSVQLVDNEAALRRHLRQLVQRFEHVAPDVITESITARLLPHIVGIDLQIRTVTGKFKLSQNRPAEDRQNVLAWFNQGGDNERELAALSEQLGLA